MMYPEDNFSQINTTVPVNESNQNIKIEEMYDFNYPMYEASRINLKQYPTYSQLQKPLIPEIAQDTCLNSSNI